MSSTAQVQLAPSSLNRDRIDPSPIHRTRVQLEELAEESSPITKTNVSERLVSQSSSSSIVSQITASHKKRPTQHKNEIYQKLMTRNLNFSNSSDLEVLVTIMEKDSNQKTQNDLRIIQNALGHIRTFQDLSNDIPPNQMANLYKELRHAVYPSRKIVFNQGEIGREFYIILSGSVFIIGNEDKKAQNQKQENNVGSLDEINEGLQSPAEEPRKSKKQSVLTRNSKQIRNRSVANTLASSIKPELKEEANEKAVNQIAISNSSLSSMAQISQFQKNPDEITDEEYIAQQFPDFDILTKLEAGASFGEVALKDCVPRTATAICSGETHFITLRREAFRKILDSYYQQVHQQNIMFVKEISIFKEWPDQMIHQMFYYMEKKIFRMNQVIYKEGSDPDGIYLIREGDVKIYKGISLMSSVPNRKERMKSVIHFMRAPELNNLLSFQTSISLLGSGQMFGHDEIVNNTTRKQTAICSSSQCTFHFLNKEKFLLYSKRRNTIENAIEESNRKQEWHNSMIEQLQMFCKNQDDFLRRSEQKSLKHKRQQSAFEQPNNQIGSNTSFRHVPATATKYADQSQNESMPMLPVMQTPLSSKIPSYKMIPQNGSSLDQSLASPSFFLTSEKANYQEVKPIVQSSGGNSNEFMLNKSAIKSMRSIPKFQSNSFSLDQGAFQKIQNKMPARNTGNNRSQLQGSSFHSTNYHIPGHFISTELKKGYIQQPSVDENKNTRNIIKASNSYLDESRILGEIKRKVVGRKNNNNSTNEQQQQQLDYVLGSDSRGIEEELNKTTIRKEIFQTDSEKTALQLDKCLHISIQMHKNLNSDEPPVLGKPNEIEPVKLDLENQMIQVCENDDPAFKRRVENLYPQIVSYEAKRQGSNNTKNSTNLVVPESEQQERILKALRLPRIYQADSESMLRIFKRRGVPVLAAATGTDAQTDFKRVFEDDSLKFSHSKSIGSLIPSIHPIQNKGIFSNKSLNLGMQSVYPMMCDFSQKSSSNLDGKVRHKRNQSLNETNLNQNTNEVIDSPFFKKQNQYSPKSKLKNYIKRISAPKTLDFTLTSH